MEYLFMKFRILTAGFLALILPFSTYADQIEIESTGITFDSPADFTVYTEELISKKWPSNQAPKWAVGNETGSTTIAYDIKPSDISQAPLDEVLKSFEQLLERMVPGLEWIEKDVITIEGKEWIFLEMTSNAVDADIYNIMLVTSYEQEMLIFNFNSTVADFSQYETELRNSIKSIQLNN